jgi:hypothetical protein
MTTTWESDGTRARRVIPVATSAGKRLEVELWAGVTAQGKGELYASVQAGIRNATFSCDLSCAPGGADLCREATVAFLGLVGEWSAPPGSPTLAALCYARRLLADELEAEIGEEMSR